MMSKEFYEGNILRLQKMVKHGVYVLLFDAFAIAVQIPFIFAGKWGCNALDFVHRRIFCSGI